MILNTRIKEILQGVEYVSECDGAVMLHRFDPSEEEYYKNEKMYRRYVTSGVKLSFITDSKSLFLKLRVEHATPSDFFSHDVYCNRTLIGRISNFTESDLPLTTDREYTLGDFEGSFDLGEGLKEVTVMFPWTVKSLIKEISVDDGAIVRPAESKGVMLSYGDSITYGASAAYPSSRPFARLAEYFGVEEICKGVGGEVFCPGLIDDKKAREVKYVTVAYGVNEMNSDVDDFTERCKLFFEKLVRCCPNAEVFAISPLWCVFCRDEKKYKMIKYVEKTIEEVASGYKNVNFINGYDLIPRDEKILADKIVHPNDEGFEYYYENLIKKIEEYTR